MSIIIYTITVFCSTVMAYVAEKKNSKIAVFMLVALLSLIAGLRGNNVGNDTYGYIKIFESYGTWSYIREPAFRAYAYLLMTLTHDAHACILVTSTITNAFMIAGYWKIRSSCSFSRSVFAYCMINYFLTFSGVRQWLSISLIMFSISYIFDDKKIKYLICIILSISLHYSSVIALSLYLIYNMQRQSVKTRKGKKVIAVIFALLLSVVILSIIVSNYSNQYDFSSITKSGTSQGVYMVIYRAVIAIMFLILVNKMNSRFYRKKLNISNNSKKYESTELYQQYMLFAIMYLFWSITTYIGMGISNVSRIGWTFLIGQPCIYAVSTKYKNVNLARIITIAIDLLLIYTFIQMLISPGNGEVPYYFYWSNAV